MSGYIKNDKKYGWDYDRKDRCDCGRKFPSDCGKEIDCAKCEPLSPCPKKILFECGTPGGEMTFTTTGQTCDVANVTVDTSCFCKPITELQFSSQVKAVVQPTASDTTPTDAQVVLLFELICRRNGGSDITIGSWTFRRFLSGPVLAVGETAQTLETTDTFSFNRCICSSPCQGCIDYFVRVTASLVSTDANQVSNASATVSNGQLAAKIQDC